MLVTVAAVVVTSEREIVAAVLVMVMIDSNSTRPNKFWTQTSQWMS